MKGVLPVPREIFPKRVSASDKTSPKSLAAATPEPMIDKTSPAKIAATSPKTAGIVSWKARQADSRRQNLRESLIELQYRKQRNDRSMAGRSARKQSHNKKMIAAPDPPDVFLTNPTVLSFELPSRRSSSLPDPNRKTRLEGKRVHVLAHRRDKQEERRDQLHNLYANAGSFITTGEQLDQVVDAVFGDNGQFDNDMKAGRNIWNLGEPETVQELLGKGTRTGKAIDSAGGGEVVARERVRHIGEILTGGKMVEG